MRIPTPVPVEALSEQPAGSLTFTKTARTLARARPPGSSSAPNATCFWSPVRSVRVLHNYSNHVVGGASPLEIAAKAARSRRSATDSPNPVRMAKQLREREVDELAARYQEIRNMRQEFRMSRTTVAKHLADRGVDTSRGMKPADVTRAVELYAEGLSSVNIGKQLGFDNHTVISALRSEGVVIRKALGKQ